MKIDGKIEGFLEASVLQAVVSLSVQMVPDSFSVDDQLALGKQMSDLMNEGRTAIPADLFRRTFPKMAGVLAALDEVGGDARRMLGISDLRLKFFSYIMQDLEIAYVRNNPVEATEFRPTAGADRSQDPEVAKLLADAKLMKEGEEVSSLIDGRVIDFHSGGGKGKLVILFADAHDNVPALKQTRANLLRLVDRGVPLLASEGFSGDLDFAAMNAENPGMTYSLEIPGQTEKLQLSAARCAGDPKAYIDSLDDKPLQAIISVECLLGSKVTTIGVDDDKLIDEAFKLFGAEYLDELGPVEYFFRRAEVHFKRTAGMAKKTADRMDRLAGMVAGWEHILLITESLKTKGIDYIVVAVPAFVASLEEHSQRIRKGSSE